MSDQPPTAAKVCGSCGADVTSKPRVKDTEGRYFCRECAAKMQAALAKKVTKSAGPTPGASSKADADIMSMLVADSMAKGAKACPACRRPWKEDAMICTGCGFNKQTGLMVGTQVRQGDKKRATPRKER